MNQQERTKAAQTKQNNPPGTGIELIEKDDSLAPVATGMEEWNSFP